MIENNTFTKIGSNMKTTITEKGFPILYSYTTPVAGRDEKGEFRTDRFYSVTTSRHINKWFNCDSKNKIGRIVKQSYINGLVR